NTRREVEYLAQFLRNYGYDAAEISSDLMQKAREKVMGELRRGELRFLVATDVAARGIDVSDLTHVFMYDVPQDREYYVHRAGRTARAGKTGVAITLATKQDEPNLRELSGRYAIEFDWRDVPTEEEVAERVSERLVVLLERKLREASNLEKERMQRFVPLAQRLVEEDEPELLAMILDEVYHESLHGTDDEEDESDAPRQQERREKTPGRGRGRGRKHS
ncbi:MAG: C-terminal helicase domain-containing protein, partial [Rhodothermales bacterium]|nr:C-terminal helicase domain-containing protein [Rhodothermales bacterium]